MTRVASLAVAAAEREIEASRALLAEAEDLKRRGDERIAANARILALLEAEGWIDEPTVRDGFTTADAVADLARRSGAPT